MGGALRVRENYFNSDGSLVYLRSLTEFVEHVESEVNVLTWCFTAQIKFNYSTFHTYNRFISCSFIVFYEQSLI